jgi:sRNA-binding protein
MTRDTLKLRPGTPPRPKPQPDPATVARTWFMQAYPLLFNPLHPVPLALRIRTQLRKARPAHVSDSGVRRALAAWCSSPAYLDALTHARNRHGLTGPDGKVTDEQRERARR